MTVWALTEAKNQGYVVSAGVLADTTKWTKDLFVPQFSKPRDPRWGFNFISRRRGLSKSTARRECAALSTARKPKAFSHDGRAVAPSPGGAPRVPRSATTATIRRTILFAPRG